MVPESGAEINRRMKRVTSITHLCDLLAAGVHRYEANGTEKIITRATDGEIWVRNACNNVFRPLSETRIYDNIKRGELYVTSD